MIYDLDQRCYLARNVYDARSWMDRLRGMIGRRFDSFDAMIFENCTAIHTCFMSFPIDVVFLNEQERVTALYHHLDPWCVYAPGRGGRVALEFPAGTLKRTGTKIGNYVNWHFSCDPKLEQDALAAYGEGVE